MPHPRAVSRMQRRESHIQGCVICNETHCSTSIPVVTGGKNGEHWVVSCTGNRHIGNRLLQCLTEIFPNFREGVKGLLSQPSFASSSFSVSTWLLSDTQNYFLLLFLPFVFPFCVFLRYFRNTHRKQRFNTLYFPQVKLPVWDERSWVFRCSVPLHCLL